MFNLVEGVDGQAGWRRCAPRMLARLGAALHRRAAEAMAVTNDKPLTKTMLREAGLATPDWAVPPDWAGLDGAALDRQGGAGGRFAGPGRWLRGGGRARCLTRAAECAARFGGDWFAERYIEGREFNIAVLDGHAVRAADGGNALRALAGGQAPHRRL